MHLTSHNNYILDVTIKTHDFLQGLRETSWFPSTHGIVQPSVVWISSPSVKDVCLCDDCDLIEVVGKCVNAYK